MEASSRGVSATLGFHGPHHFLSNSWDREPVCWNGVVAPSAEHHFNAAKTLDTSQTAEVYRQETPARAKYVGQRVALRADWGQVKVNVMASILEAKFSAPGLREALAATGDNLLVENNTWHDQFWGDCTCKEHSPHPGKNMLGTLLMELRGRLRGDPANRAPRVAVTGHRPHGMSLDQQEWVRGTLPGVISDLIATHGLRVALSGMALGADMWWAEAALDAGLDLWSYVPFEAQADRWKRADEDHWRYLRSRASHEVVLGQGYDVRLLYARNNLLLRDANLVVAVHHPAKTTGGTASTIRAARASGKPMIRMNVMSKEVTHV